jgi:hypothetical protein
MLVADDASRPRLLLFHAHINVLGWITLTVLGTVVTLWPTVLRTRMVDGAVPAARTALRVAVVGLAALAVGALAWWPVVAAGGLALVGVAVLIQVRPAVAAARAKPPSSFAAWSMAAGAGWLLVALVMDGWVLVTAGGPATAADGFGTALIPLLVGFAAQTLLGALTYLLPVALGGGPGQVRAATAALDRNGALRASMGNAALLVFLLPVGPYVRITTSMLVVVALVLFLVPATRLILNRSRS